MDIEIFNVDAWYAIWNGGTFPADCPSSLSKHHWFVRLSRRSWKRLWRKETNVWCCYCGARQKI